MATNKNTYRTLTAMGMSHDLAAALAGGPDKSKLDALGIWVSAAQLTALQTALDELITRVEALETP